LLGDTIYSKLKGIGFVMVFAVMATIISELSIFKTLQISPLIIGIVLGMIYANTLRHHIPQEWLVGIQFCAKTLLRVAIVFYGFRITFSELVDVGIEGLIVSIIMVATTFLLGAYVGIKYFKMDRDLAYLTASGSSVCGAAAVLATEPITKSQSHKSAIAISTVVLFGTIGMFLYPALYKLGIFDLDAKSMGIYVGATIHEVAQVVAVGGVVGGDGANSAVLVKMTRVVLIVPLLLLLGLYIKRAVEAKDSSSKKDRVSVPWFVLGFVAMIVVNSILDAPKDLVESINYIDTFMLTMAMSALGMGTYIEKFKTSGAAPVYVAGIMFIWLIIGGYFITKATVVLFS
jgi:uncharacterized integral membrane protein (TIGR00698 family)